MKDMAAVLAIAIALVIWVWGLFYFWFSIWWLLWLLFGWSLAGLAGCLVASPLYVLGIYLAKARNIEGK